MDHKRNEKLYNYMILTSKEVDKYIAKKLMGLKREDTKLFEVVSHLFEIRRNKPKLRATFGRLIYEALSDRGWREILPILAFMELSTISTYVLDDIIDEQTQRDAKKATWQKYGLNYGLIGGGLQAFISLQMLFDLKVNDRSRLEILNMAIEMWEVLWEGEGQNEHMKKGTTLEAYLDRSYKVCAIMFETLAKMVAIVAGAKKKEICYAEELGQTFGMAVMIRNDLTNFLPEKIMRKKSTALSRRSFEDARKGIWTHPIICAMHKGSLKNKVRINSLLGKKESKEKELLEITNILMESGCLDDSLSMISTYKGKALNCVKGMKKDEPRRLLIDLFGMLENTRIYMKNYKCDASINKKIPDPRRTKETEPFTCKVKRLLD